MEVHEGGRIVTILELKSYEKFGRPFINQGLIYTESKFKVSNLTSSFLETFKVNSDLPEK